MTLMGVDVGGTKTLAVRVQANGEVIARRNVSTPQGSALELVDHVAALLTDLHDGSVAAWGVALPGMVDTGRGVLVYAPRPLLRSVPFRDMLAKRTGLRVHVHNDANAAAWAEYSIGAGVGDDNMLSVTVGTGVGCGAIVHGRLLGGAHGFAAEIGTMSVDGHALEDVASGTAIVRLAREACIKGSLRLRVDSSLITGQMVTAAARDGDVTARGILARVGTELGIGIATLVNILDPSLVVVSGGAAEAGHLLLDAARRSCSSVTYGQRERPPVRIVHAKLGSEASAVGAALLAGAGPTSSDL